MARLKNHITFRAGAGSPVVFLHGIEEDGSFWFPIDRAVAEFRRAISVDLLGYGRSPKSPKIPYDKSAHVKALAETVSDLKIKEKFTLVGHSMGCYVALGFAAAYPEKVERVILLSPVVILKDTDIVEDGLTDAMKVEALENVGVIRRFFRRLISSPKTSPELAKSLNNFSTSSKNIETLVEEQDMPGDLKKLSAIPVTMVYGAIDPLVVPENLKFLAQEYSNIKLIELPTGHDPVHGQPEAVFKLIVPEATRVPDVTYQKLWRK